MKSVTLDDIFHDYGLSVWRYIENDDDVWDIITDEGRIQPDHIISKTKIIIKNNAARITNKSLHENLQTKHYIQIGEECPICYESILHKKTALLTNCGHAFHYKCIINYEYHHVKEFENFDVVCPMCRQNMGYIPELKNKYFNDCTALDKLENHNETLTITNPLFCAKCFQVKGFNKYCVVCSDYISVCGNKLSCVRRKLKFDNI